MLRVASIRSCGIVIAWIATRPPGASTRSRVSKYVGQNSWPTASIISTDTHGVVRSPGRRSRGSRTARPSTRSASPAAAIRASASAFCSVESVIVRTRRAPPGGPDRELAPAGADLEHPGARGRRRPGRAAARSCGPGPRVSDSVPGVGGGGRPRWSPPVHGSDVEQRGGVAQRRVEEQLEELVGQVVVVGDVVAGVASVLLLVPRGGRAHDEGAQLLQRLGDQVGIRRPAR